MNRLQTATRVAIRQPGAGLTALHRLPFLARLIYALFRDPRVGLAARALLVSLGVYLLSPVDLLPDLAPLLGQVDDLSLLFLGCSAFLRLCPREVVVEHELRLGTPRTA